MLRCESIVFLAIGCVAPSIAIAGPGNYNQQAKLVGSGAIGNANQGSYVAVSADGNTALLGAPNDDGGFGAAFVFTRSNGLWTQQGPKLTGSGGNFGASVALSGDGNTAAVGVPGCAGEVVIFARAGGVWGKQADLVGTPTLSQCPHQGTDVALSGDGNTLVESASADEVLPPEQPTDCDNLPPGQLCGLQVGAAWVFTRSNGVWTQQVKFPFPPSEAGGGNAGGPVAISADGNTLQAAGIGVYVRSGNAWTSQAAGGGLVDLTSDGNTLVSTFVFSYRKNGVWNATGPAEPLLNGYPDFIRISADGSTLAGVYGINPEGVSLFTLSGGIWTLHHTYPTPHFPSTAGRMIALSANGNTMIVGTPGDFSNSIPGGALVFASPQLSTSLTHAGNFSHSQTNAKYTITVKNIGDREIHAAATSAVNVIDKLPAGLIATAISGPGWNCTLSSVSCTRQDGLGIGASFPPVTVTVTVASSAASKVTNVATASGGGSNWGNANDVTFIIP